MLALIDGDVLTFRVGFTTEDSEWWVAKARIEEMFDRVLAETGADAYALFLSDKTKNNFRTTFYPEYKANRRGRPLPKHYPALRDLLIESYGAEITLGQEADDALGIAQTEMGNQRIWADGGANSVICSVDKDLLQIPGTHYNFVKQEFYEVSENEGLYNFYKQILTGDVGDNVRGLEGIGPVRAAKILFNVRDPVESAYFSVVLDAYFNHFSKLWEANTLNHAQETQVKQLLLVTGRALKIRRIKDEIWNFPEPYLELQPSTEPPASSTPSTPEEITPSTEPTTTEPMDGC